MFQTYRPKYKLESALNIAELIYHNSVRAVRKTHENAFMAILAAGFTPIPFKVFTIASGMFKVPLTTLVVASAFSRSARFLLVAGFVYLFGERAKELIDKYFDILTILFTVALIGGFVLLKYI